METDPFYIMFAMGHVGKTLSLKIGYADDLVSSIKYADNSMGNIDYAEAKMIAHKLSGEFNMITGSSYYKYGNEARDDAIRIAQDKMVDSQSRAIIINGHEFFEDVLDDDVAKRAFPVLNEINKLDLGSIGTQSLIREGILKYSNMQADDAIKSTEKAFRLLGTKKNDIDMAVMEILNTDGKSTFSTNIVKVAGELSGKEENEIAFANLARSAKNIGFSGDSINFMTPRGRVTLSLLAAATAAATIDMQLELRDASNCGTDNICLYGNEWPHDLRNEALTKQKVIKDKIDDKKPIVQLVGEESNAFYLASPCKADLTIAMDTCECVEYYPSDKIYAKAVVDEYGYQVSYYEIWKKIWLTAHSGGDVIDYSLIDRHEVLLSFPGQRYKGEDITFSYVPEGETEPVTRTYLYDQVYDDPVEFDAALRYLASRKPADISETSPSNEGIKLWYRAMNPDSQTQLSEFVDGIRRSSFVYQGLTYMNYEQGTTYTKCVKPSWITTQREVIPCVKVKGTPYYDTNPNFCYETTWDAASKAEAVLAVAEVAGGVVVGAMAGASSGGVAAYGGYCATNVFISAAGAWALAGVSSNDKWPKGLIQDIV